MTALLLLIAFVALIAFVLWVRVRVRRQEELIERYLQAARAGEYRPLSTAELDHVGLGSDGADEAIKRSGK